MASVSRALAEFTKARPALHKMIRPLADKYMDLAGHRKIGLVYDDLIAEENPVVQKALSRLPPRLQYDRMFRQRRAMQCSLSHTILPPAEQITPEQDTHYLQPYIDEVEREIAERRELDSLTRK